MINALPDIQFRKFKVLQGRAKEEAEKLGNLKPDDLLLVRTLITEGAPPIYEVQRVIGDPMSFLQELFLKPIKYPNEPLCPQCGLPAGQHAYYGYAKNTNYCPNTDFKVLLEAWRERGERILKAWEAWRVLRTMLAEREDTSPFFNGRLEPEWIDNALRDLGVDANAEAGKHTGD